MIEQKPVIRIKTDNGEFNPFSQKDNESVSLFEARIRNILAWVDAFNTLIKTGDPKSRKK